MSKVGSNFVDSIVSDSSEKLLNEVEKNISQVAIKIPEPNTFYKRTLSGGLQSPKSEVPKSKILQRINSKKAAKSYQLGYQLSLKWSTGVGPRFGCIADYTLELRLQALKLTNLTTAPSFAFTRLSPREVIPLVSSVSCPALQLQSLEH